jgi:hypothetical protein
LRRCSPLRLSSNWRKDNDDEDEDEDDEEDANPRSDTAEMDLSEAGEGEPGGGPLKKVPQRDSKVSSVGQAQAAVTAAAGIGDMTNRGWLR